MQVKNTVPFLFGDNQQWILPQSFNVKNKPTTFSFTNTHFGSHPTLLKSGIKRKWQTTLEEEEYFKYLFPLKRIRQNIENKNQDNNEQPQQIFNTIQQVDSRHINVFDHKNFNGENSFSPKLVSKLLFYPLLLEYQKPHVCRSSYILQEHFTLLEASTTGTGKSFTSFGISEGWVKLKDPNIRPKIAVVCPKPILGEFIRLSKQFEKYVDIVFVCNLELLCRGKYIPWSRYQEQKQIVDIDEKGKLQTINTVQQDKSKGKGSVVCPYVTRIETKKIKGRNNTNNNNANNNNTKNTTKENDDEDDDIFNEEEYSEATYEWKLPPYTTVVFDEAHKVRNPGTCYNNLVKSLVEKYSKIPIDKCKVRCVLASATILENAKSGLASLMFLLGYIKSVNSNEVRKLLNAEPLRSKLAIRESADLPPYTTDEIDMRVLHYLLYHHKKYRTAARMVAVQTSAANPNLKIVHSEIKSETYTMTKESEVHINQALGELLIALEDLKSKQDDNNDESKDENQDKTKDEGRNKTKNENIKSTKSIGAQTALIRILRARQIIEHYKLPTIVQNAINLYNDGWSLVIFVNFKQSAFYILKQLQIAIGSSLISLVIGGQKTKERDFNIQLFQQDKTRILITTIASGGASISLQDKIGKYPRYALISPPISATQLKQCLGRVDRSGAVTDSKQRLVFCRNTIEEKVALALNVKIRAMDFLNDGKIHPNTLTLFEFAQVNANSSSSSSANSSSSNSSVLPFQLYQSNFNTSDFIASLIPNENDNGIASSLSTDIQFTPGVKSTKKPTTKKDKNNKNSNNVNNDSSNNVNSNNIPNNKNMEKVTKLKAKLDINNVKQQDSSGKIDWEKVDEIIDQE